MDEKTIDKKIFSTILRLTNENLYEIEKICTCKDESCFAKTSTFQVEKFFASLIITCSQETDMTCRDIVLGVILAVRDFTSIMNPKREITLQDVVCEMNIIGAQSGDQWKKAVKIDTQQRDKGFESFKKEFEGKMNLSKKDVEELINFLGINTKDTH